MRHSVADRSRTAFSVNIFLETAPAEAANAAISWRSAKTVGQLSLTLHGTGKQSGTRAYQYGHTNPASTHLLLRQTPQSSRLQRPQQRTQAGVSRTRAPPLAAQGGTGGLHAGSAAGAVSNRWRRHSVQRQYNRGVWGSWVRVVGLRRAVRWPLPRQLQRLHRPRLEQLLWRLPREQQLGVSGCSHVSEVGWCCCGGRDRRVGSLGAMKGGRHARDGGWGCRGRRSPRSPTCAHLQRAQMGAGWGSLEGPLGGAASGAALYAAHQKLRFRSHASVISLLLSAPVCRGAVAKARLGMSDVRSVFFLASHHSVR